MIEYVTGLNFSFYQLLAAVVITGFICSIIHCIDISRAEKKYKEKVISKGNAIIVQFKTAEEVEKYMWNIKEMVERGNE